MTVLGERVRLTGEAFDRAAEQTKLTAKSKEMARLHLVDGLPLEAAGTQVLGLLAKEDGSARPARWRVRKAVLSILKVALPEEHAKAKSRLTRATSAEFERLADLTELGEEAREMARRYFVLGMTMDQAGEKFGVDRRRVNHAVQAIRRVFGQKADTTGAIVSANMRLPAAIVGEIEGFSDAYAQCGSDELKIEAVETVATAVRKATRALKA